MLSRAEEFMIEGFMFWDYRARMLQALWLMEFTAWARCRPQG